MVFRDTAGNVIDKGTRISFPLGLGQSAHGVIAETSSGLGLSSRQPVVVLQVSIVLPADQNGIVAGVVRIPDERPQESSLVAE